MIDITYYKSAARSDGLDNGGGKSGFRVYDNMSGNVFPLVTAIDVLIGLTRYRKIFGVPAFDYTILDKGMKIFLSKISPAEDGCLIRAGTDTDVQDDAEDYTGWKGVGTLLYPAQFGLTSWLLVKPDVDGLGFNAGDTVIISNDDTWDYLTVASVETISDQELKLWFSDGSAIYNAYQIGDSVSACVSVATVTQFALWMKSIIPQDMMGYSDNYYKLRALAW